MGGGNKGEVTDDIARDLKEEKRWRWRYLGGEGPRGEKRFGLKEDDKQAFHF